MSRLYINAGSDKIKTKRTARGHAYVSAELFYGSASDSKLAACIELTWIKGNDRPTLFIEIPAGLDVQINGKDLFVDSEKVDGCKIKTTTF